MNQMVSDGVVDNYALGGAVAAIFYIEPLDTQDVDIFIQVTGRENDLAILAPIYDYLLARGYEARAEHIYIEGFPVQFLPAFNPLIKEAIAQAPDVKLQAITIRIISPEHLIAIMLDTGRLKDYLRINLFLQSANVDRQQLDAILKRHGLDQKWAENAYRFEP
jgi:hypothetical protein